MTKNDNSHVIRTVMVPTQLKMPVRWFAIVHKKKQSVVAMFDGSDMASDVLFGEDGSRPSYFDDHKDYEIIEISGRDTI